MTHETLQQFFGLMALLNIAYLLIATLALMLFGDRVKAIHARMTGVPQEALPAAYFTSLANYKIATIVFTLVPWLALVLMG
ncbi:hypothetical protein PSA7680_03507 [Pseudoruegeria aquimaris]|uniref:DUF6868 domain-containing protein n=1 Tax=Pseudoruegeria aquimaris TaxID=393663 RepID=A0A1Y5TNF7_9RHOB|nr:hypothetical protein [Pseudoruegeria aquimaris]SLN66259.1 hypothetical protein PSA7680_03507 [Pseudoruegeria aquimaris]